MRRVVIKERVKIMIKKIKETVSFYNETYKYPKYFFASIMNFLMNFLVNFILKNDFIQNKLQNINNTTVLFWINVVPKIFLTIAIIYLLMAIFRFFSATKID